MSRGRRVKSWRERRAEQLAAARRKSDEVQADTKRRVDERQAQERFLRGVQAGRYRQGALAGDGCQPNNMAAYVYSEEVGGVVSPVVVLQQGIDSIWLNIYGSIKEDVIECLQMSKEEAQSSEGDWALSPLPPFDGTTPLTYASGVKYYDYLCRSEDVSVKVRRPSRTPRPAAVIRVAAQALWRLGGGGLPAIRLAADWLRPLFGDDYRVMVSMVHLARDYQGWSPELADLQNVVSRAGDVPIEDDADGGDVPSGAPYAAYRNRAKVLTGITSGKSDNLRLNFYNKSHQIKQKHLGWVESLWEACEGYRPELPVWRVEFQYGREFLHAREIETIEQLCSQLAALWAYGMGWYSFRTPNATDSNRSRWVVAPAWEKLSAWWGVVTGQLPKVKVVRPKLRRLALQGFGVLTSIAALCGGAETREEGPIDPGSGSDPETLAGIRPIATDDPYAVLGYVLSMVKAEKGAEKMERVLAEKRLRYAGFTMVSA